MSTLQTAAILLALFLTVPLVGGITVALHDVSARRLIPWIATRALPNLRAALARARARALRTARHQPRQAANAGGHRRTERPWGTENVAALARGKRDARSGRRNA